MKKANFKKMRRMIGEFCEDEDLDEDEATRDHLFFSLEEQTLLRLEPDQHCRYEFFGHGERLSTSFNPDLAAPSLAFLVENRLYFLDGQHRAASALAEGKAFEVITVDGSEIEDALTGRGHMRPMSHLIGPSAANPSVGQRGSA